ncbi:PREDICTED: dual specificity protein phosphatase 13 isoform A-like [Gekko japonicus]|uniref:Dual specificity protein phosphatase 13 isoform A-like n=1 Tax=Gekko japonicus TaxID=146911 RepID=A0ABM1K8H3_GEKJA|nr:PREDICTED: dual specificity protein phosphatase 13 isoform A-like [Gekko japonicus]
MERKQARSCYWETGFLKNILAQRRSAEERRCGTRLFPTALLSPLPSLPSCPPAPLLTGLQSTHKDCRRVSGPPSEHTGSLGPFLRLQRTESERLAAALTMADEDTLPSADPECSGPGLPETPTVKELEELLNTGRPSWNHVDEVWPNLFLGDHIALHSRFGLWKMGISHVLNAAHGTLFCHEPHDFYGTTIEYYGVPAHDLPDFDMSPYFYPAADFIHKALSIPGAKVLVHCAVGISRSSSLVLAYLMIYHHLPLTEATEAVKKHRWIFPNRGFQEQLRILDIQLRQR